MKTNLSCLAFLFMFSIPSFMEVEMEEALTFLKTRQTDIEKISASWSSPAAEVVAIISPELIRYNLLRDFFETQALEVVYVGFGAEAADFSIGYFQMKPSFAELVESRISQNPIFQSRFKPLITYSQSSAKAQRFARIERLKNFTWQLEYANAFYQILLDQQPFLLSLPPEERIAFAASAYNLGFESPPADIEDWQCVAAFPYGKKFSGPQAAYADIAVAFFQKMQSPY